jgi:hypothetical protein
MSPEATQRLRTAIHEAGHAVVAVRLGFRPVRTTILGGGKMKYRFREDDARYDFSRPAIARRECCVCLAGPLAEAIAEHGADNIDLRPAWATMPGVDFESARRHAQTVARHSGRRRDSVLNELASETHRWLASWRNWCVVETVAAELFEQETLRYGDVSKFVKRPVREPTPAEIEKRARRFRSAAMARDRERVGPHTSRQGNLREYAFTDLAAAMRR